MFIITHSGQRFYYREPEKFEYSVSDIGFALGNLCRFAGHGGMWSVAQHSLFVASLVEPRDKLRALLHDASEAYLVDVPGPLKQMRMMDGYRELEARVMEAIHRKFGVPNDEEAEKRVKQADLIALRAEASMLGLLNKDWDVWNWPEAVIPTEIRAMNNGQAGKEFERMAVWLMEQ